MEAPAPGARFRFFQFEFAFALGPPDGRYLVRESPEAEPEYVIVLRTTGAPPRPLIGRRRTRRSESEEPQPVPVVPATVIIAESLESTEEAADWLKTLRGDTKHSQMAATGMARALNRLLRAYRAAAADPTVRDVAPAGANVVRLGYGSGDQVADGRWEDAYDIPPEDDRSKVRRRSAALAPDERLAAILGGRDQLLACEELVLRARSDLDAGHGREAALQARIALEALLAELDAETTGELAGERDAVGRAANAALRGELTEELHDAVGTAVALMDAALRRRRIGHVTST